MAKVKLLYCGTEKSGTETYTLTMYANANNEIFIGIDSEGQQSSFICLDRSTAIKLSKELRKEISNLEAEW